MAEGSSPLTRGKRQQDRDPGEAARLIPAHAGKTPDRNRPARHDRAHPRSRGENPASDRGTPWGSGLIPAHAGKTRTGRRRRRSGRAHPRSRGENGALPADGMEIDGSSPLTRGKLPARPAPGSLPGLIPAHAGKTTPGEGGGGAPMAHPRSRGENNGCLAVDTPRVGSSPLTRGKPARVI